MTRSSIETIHAPMMPPRTPLSTPIRGWRCPRCQLRAFFSTTRRRTAVGPEHPSYIEVPQPPQQSLPYRPFVKGSLPVPRDIFAGAQGKDRASDEEIAKATKRPARHTKVDQGSREEWKQKMSEARRRNLREGLKGLRARKTTTDRQMAERRARQWAERAELAARPEREDERLTTPSHGLDLEKLMKGPLPDPTREARLQRKARNLELHHAAKRAERLDHLHTLYMNARSFIVTPEQLDEAVDNAFDDPPWREAGAKSYWGMPSIPYTVQDMLNRAHRSGGKMALDAAGGFGEINKERVRRIAEKLTGGKMEE